MAQLKKKFIGNDQVGASKILLENDANLRARNFANDGDINILKVDADDVIQFASVPQVSADAIEADDLVRYQQVANLLAGQKPKTAVATVALVDVDLSSAVDQSLQGGHTIVDGQRVLLANQTAPEENGIYDAVTAIDAQTWVRSADFDEESDIPGAWTVVQFGDEAGKVYVTTSAPAVLDTDSIVFIKEAAAAQVLNKEELIALDATDITNQYFDLDNAAFSADSISVFALEGGIQEKAVDYTISLTGGAGGVTRISLAGGLATAGVSALVDGDKLVVRYEYI
jgi:hypothetical protein